MTSEEVKNILLKDSFVSRHKSVMIIFFKLIISAGLLYYIISYVDFNEILNAIVQANKLIISIALLLSFLNIYLQFKKWQITANAVLKVNNNSKIWLSLFYGFSAGVFTPARIGEYFGRAIVFKNKSLLQVTLATLLDKIFLLLTISFFGSIASILYIHYQFHMAKYLTIGLFIIFAALFYIIFLLIFNDRIWDNTFVIKLISLFKLQWLFEKIKVYRKLDKKYSVYMVVVSTMFYVCILAQYAILVSAFSNNYNFFEYLWAGNLLMFAKTIIPPVSLAELGIREGASVYFITQLGESASTGFNASIFLFFINVLLPSLAGLTMFLKKSND